MRGGGRAKREKREAKMWKKFNYEKKLNDGNWKINKIEGAIKNKNFAEHKLCITYSILRMQNSCMNNI